MMNPQNNISSQIARQILIEAEKNGLTVESYLKNLADEQSEEQSGEDYYKITIRKASIDYDFTESQKWLKNNAQKYAGKWVVLDGKRFIGAGDNPLPFVEKARQEGVKVPFVQFIEDNSKPSMGGWL